MNAECVCVFDGTGISTVRNAQRFVCAYVCEHESVYVYTYVHRVILHFSCFLLRPHICVNKILFQHTVQWN